MKIFNLAFMACVFMLFNQELLAQNHRIIDSLKLLISNGKTSDSTLITSYNDLGIQYAPSDPKLAKSYMNKALDIARHSKNQRGIAGAQNCLGIVHYYEKEYDSALVLFNKALAINRKEKHYWGQASALHQIGVIHKMQANYPQAIASFQESGKLFKSMNDSISLAKSIENIGSSYYLMGHYQKAMLFFLKAIKIYEIEQNVNGMSRGHTHFGRILIEQKEYRKALDYLKKALIDIKKTGNINSITSTLVNIGKCYSALKDYDIGLRYTKEALEYIESSKNKKNIAFIQSMIGEIYYNSKEYTKGIDFLKKSLKNHPPHGSYVNEIFTYYILAKSYLAINKLGLAKKHINKALEISKKIKNLEGEKNSYTILAQIAEKEGNTIKTLKYYKKLLILKDSIFEIEKEKQLRELQMMYETEQKEKQIDQQKSEIQLLKQQGEINKLQRTLLGTSLVLILIVFGFGFYSNRQKIVRSRLLAKQSELEKKRLDDELAFRKRELTTHALHLAKKNIVLEKVKESVEKFMLTGKENNTIDHRELIQIIRRELSNDESWESFRNYFENVHPDFYTIAKQKYPNVTQGELRLMALIKMNLSYKEIGGVLNITTEGTKKARYRLRKKLSIRPDESLQDLVRNLQKN